MTPAGARGARASTIALVAFAFAAGTALGVLADRRLAPAPTFRTRVVRDMSGVLEGLGLTPEQRSRAEAILEESAPRTEEAMHEAAARLRMVADSVDARLRAILTPEQRSRLDQLRRDPTFIIKRKTPGRETTVDTLRRAPPGGI